MLIREEINTLKRNLSLHIFKIENVSFTLVIEAPLDPVIYGIIKYYYTLPGVIGFRHSDLSLSAQD